MKYRKLIFGLSIFTAASTVFYWILVFTGAFPLTEIVPGYKIWSMSFPLADLWIVIASGILAFAVIKNRVYLARIWGLISASSMIFLALNGLMFGINTGMICMFTVDEVIEIGIKLYCIIVGIFFIWQFSRMDTAQTLA